MENEEENLADERKSVREYRIAFGIFALLVLVIALCVELRSPHQF
jgi:hypothetical protein